MSATLIYSFFILVAGSWAQKSIYNNFLQNTLEKIQKERLENTGEFNETDVTNEFNGEIILEPGEATYENNGDTNEQPFEENIITINLDQSVTYSPSTHNVPHENAEKIKDQEIKGYYYYFYPLNHYLEKYKETEPAKDSDEMNVMMETMMKNTMMQKQENKITPLFKAMTWFIGTAMFFIISILLMPRFKVKKAKEIIKLASWEDYEVNFLQSIVNKYVPKESIVSWKNK